MKYSDGIHQRGVKEYCSNGEIKEWESFTKHFSFEEDLCLWHFTGGIGKICPWLWILVPAEGFETLDSHIVFWVTGSQSASCRVLQNCSCICVQKGGGWFCYDSPNSKGKRLSTFKSSVFILTTKRKCLEVIQATSSGTLENSMFIVVNRQLTYSTSQRSFPCWF